MIKELRNEIALPLKILFDKTMTEGKIPQDWKQAIVKPIFKKGDKHSASNYRPVSLTSVVSKLFESFIRDSISLHMRNENILSDHQFGFTTGRSCVTQLLCCLQDWLESFEDDKPVDVFYLDLQKAFDTVPHKRLLYKLENYGICDQVLAWIESFLLDRSQRVQVGNDTSDVLPVLSGVPQGSVLGPSLFLYYINDMPDALTCLVKIFADDTKAYSNISNKQDRDSLQDNLDKLVLWANDWQIRFNGSKCKVLHTGKNNPIYTYNIGDSIMEVTTAEKDLGIIVDDKLTFETHIDKTIKRANKLSGMIVHNIKCKDMSVMVPLFKALIRPIVEYGNPVWSPHLKKHINAVENVQRHFTKKIIGLSNLDYSDRLRK